MSQTCTRATTCQGDDADNHQAELCSNSTTSEALLGRTHDSAVKDIWIERWWEDI